MIWSLFYTVVGILRGWDLMRTLAIGDIHGMSSSLDALLTAVQLTPEDQLILLGDYVDRGPDSKGVIDRLIALKKRFNVICLRGNHEWMMLRAREGRDDFRNWFSVGGSQALASYAARPGMMGNLENVPAEHWAFLERELVAFHETSRHIFVHANLSPGLSPKDESEEMLCWEFLSKGVNHFSGKLVVCGHTSQKTGLPKDFGDTICIDTHAYAGGWLTCLDVDTLQYWQVDVLGRVREDKLPPRKVKAE
jgi:serine/threonine protein phosphatase 1